MGSVTSSTPAPGTITASCLRTHDATRYASMPLPRALSTTAFRPAACSCFWYQFIGMAGTPYRAFTFSGPMHMKSTMASG